MSGLITGSSNTEALQERGLYSYDNDFQHPYSASSAGFNGPCKIYHVSHRSSLFNQPAPVEFPLFTTVEKVRSQFSKGTAVMVAIGGWGDTVGFSEAAKSEASRKLFARNVKAMVDATGADGVDIDWEYPGGNGEDYKTYPNNLKEWEIAAYPLLLAEVRRALGPAAVLSAAVPGLPRDMLAFTAATVPQIAKELSFANIMTYDLMNRRDAVTKHHSGLQASLVAVDAYLTAGLPAAQANLGFAFYARWFRTRPDAVADAACAEHAHALGCPAALMEDPASGADLGRAGAFAWHDAVPEDVAGSFARALVRGSVDLDGGGYTFWDAAERRFWTWDCAEVMQLKFPAVVKQRGLGGVFAWGLGEDGMEWQHLRVLNEEVRKWKRGEQEEEEEEEERGGGVFGRSEL